MSSHVTHAQIALPARAQTIEGANALGAELYYPHRLTPLGSLNDFTFTAVAARLGPVTAGVLRYSSGIRIDTAEYGSSVQVNIPVLGSLRTSIGEEHVRATRSTAALYPHDVPTAISGWEQPCAMLAIKLDRQVVEQRLAEDDRRLDLHQTPTLDVSGGTAAAWVAAVRGIIATVQRFPGLDAGLAAFLADRCIDGFVLTVTDPGAAGAPDAPTVDRSVVHRAVEAITYSSGPPLSLHDLSAYVGASTRTIQASFRRVLGETPMQLQRRERMKRAHLDLRAAEPSRDQVQTIALRHGFTHLGRFASQYQREFGELPSKTLAS